MGMVRSVVVLPDLHVAVSYVIGDRKTVETAGWWVKAAWVVAVGVGCPLG